ncbi:MAG: Heptosyltransferase [Betaproteobacteria bacterium]|jgi:ADP-heptose:LPS heptosyltransferase|nr:Heptosyltransferase [Betaproteobacteria bacterium]
MAPLIRPSPRRIAVFRALQLGDLLCIVPALRALSNAYPDAEFTLIGLAWARDFAARYAYIDDFLEFPGAPGLPEREPDTFALPAFFSAARQRRFDVALQMHGSGEKTNSIVSGLGARVIVGFHPHKRVDLPSRQLLPWQPREREVARYLRLVEAVGATPLGDQLEFPIRQWERDELARVFGRRGIARRYVCVHPGARLPSRRWPVDRFAKIADQLATLGYSIVLTGTADEAAFARTVLQSMNHPATNLAGGTSLGALAALVEGASLVVCNDTGISHIAAAMRTPSVVISSGADAERWRPTNHVRHTTLWHNVPCRPCAHAVCPTGHECALGVDVNHVMTEARRLLEWGAACAA